MLCKSYFCTLLPSRNGHCIRACKVGCFRESDQTLQQIRYAGTISQAIAVEIHQHGNCQRAKLSTGRLQYDSKKVFLPTASFRL